MSEELCDVCGRGDWKHPIAFTGERLCDACFRVRFLERVRRMINKHRLLTPRSKVLLGVSGSAQSMAMAKAIWEIERKYMTVRVSFVHVLRWGDMVEADAVREAFGQLHLPLEKLRTVSLREKRGFCLTDLVEGKSVDRRGMCRACRHLIPSVLTVEASGIGCDVIAYGDTADELAEEALFHLCSERSDSLARMGAKRALSDGRLYRVLPLSHALKSEAASYLRSFGFSPSYSCPFRDVRKGEFSEIMAKLEEKQPGSAFSAIRSFLSLSRGLDK